MSETRINIVQLREPNEADPTTLACALTRHDDCFDVVYSRPRSDEQIPWREVGPCSCYCHSKRPPEER